MEFGRITFLYIFALYILQLKTRNKVHFSSLISLFTTLGNMTNPYFFELNIKYKTFPNLCTFEPLLRVVMWWCTSDLRWSRAGCEISSPSSMMIDIYLYNKQNIVTKSYKIFIKKNNFSDCNFQVASLFSNTIVVIIHIVK